MTRKMNITAIWSGALRGILLTGLAAIALPVAAGSGVTYYDGGAKALDDLGIWAAAATQDVITICYAIAMLISLYGATSIYIKLQMGENGFTKAVTMLVGGVLFMLFSSQLFPIIFGYNFGPAETSWKIFGGVLSF